MKRLEGKVAIVTGGGTGMGEACVKLFAREGAKVVATGRRVEKIQAVVDAVKAEGYTDVIAVQQDVSKEEDWERVVQTTIETFGEINVLVNNAGILDSVNYEDITYDNWKYVMDINGWGQMLGYKTVVPSMTRAGGGSIVVVSSMAARNSGGGLTAYCASKGASDALVRAAAVVLAPKNIRTNCILPGTIYTPMLEDAFSNEEDFNNMVQSQLLKRIGTSEEIAYYALYLASDESGFTNGTSLIIDGGIHNDPGTKVEDK